MSTLIRRSPSTAFTPFTEENGLSSLVRRMFNEPMLSTGNTPAAQWAPAVEISETSDALIITAELPGLTEKEITLSVENNVLTIAGEKEMETTDAPPATRFYVAERFYGAFQRSFTLPRSVDAERVTAEFAKGVLTISLPKVPQAKGRVIPVQGK